jgi:hypothetical protein
LVARPAHPPIDEPVWHGADRAGAAEPGVPALGFALDAERCASTISGE